MILERTMHRGWLSNSWLLGDRDGGHAVLIDSGGPMEPLLTALEQRRLTLTHVLCTHHHPDHVAHNADWKRHTGCAVCGGVHERELFRDLDVELDDGDEIRSGDLRVRALFTPGHTVGQVAFLVDDTLLATGDTLFRGSIGGTRGHGHGTYEQIKESILERLLRMPRETRVLPGHCDETTVARELEENPFVRYWTGVDAGSDLPCTAFGMPARLVVEARDYDGGTKCLVRMEDGSFEIAPGSRVVKES